MKDGNTSPKYECNVWEKSHIPQFDSAASGTDKSVYTCACGYQIIENEDCGTGV